MSHIDRTTFFDVESFSATELWNMEPRKFVRLFQWAVGDGPVQMTEDYDEMLSVLRSAEIVCGHNISNFDLTAVFGKSSIEPLEMAMAGKVVDTFVLASLVNPAPYKYTDRDGRTYFDAASPERAKRFLSLDNQAHMLGVPGKLGDLREMAKKYNPPKTLVKDLDYGLIPTNDPDFRAYAEMDVIVTRDVYKKLLEKREQMNYPGSYIWREMKLAGITAQISRNGILIDQEVTRNRVADQVERREKIMAWLVRDFDFPTEGAQPWKSAAGKGAILKALDSFGIVYEDNPDWPATASGAPSFSGDTLKAITEGKEAEELGKALAELQGQRSLAQLALDSMQDDGRVHPDITSLQRSGRWSVTKPGVTIWGSNGELAEDKRFFVADEGNVLAGFDFSSADARAMGALSGDLEFCRRFEKDENGKDIHDAHNLTGEALFGAENYYAKMGADGKPVLRPVSKAAGHAMSFNIGAKKLMTTLNSDIKKKKLPIEPFTEQQAREMIWAFNDTYKDLKKFKDRVVRDGEKGYVVNAPWKRRMVVDPDRSYNQSVAMHGQSTTREMMADAMIRLTERGEYYARSMKAIIHDELLCEFREDTIERDIAVVKECMEVDFRPGIPGSITLPFPVGAGYGRSWREANH